MNGGKLPSLADAIMIDAAEKQADGVSLTTVPHPKGPGVGRGRGRLHKAALETVEITLPAGTKIRKRRKKVSPAKASKMREKTKAGARIARKPAPGSKSPAETAQPLPSKMTRAQLEAYVAADLSRKEKQRKAKAKAQAKWRKGLK
jgi:hypothetical protein